MWFKKQTKTSKYNDAREARLQKLLALRADHMFNMGNAVAQGWATQESVDDLLRRMNEQIAELSIN